MVSKSKLNEKRKQKEHKKMRITIISLLVVVIILGAIVTYVRVSTPQYEEPNLPRPFYGVEGSNVVVVEYLDLQCPACRAAHPTINKIKENYNDSIRFEVKHFPLTQIHPQARKAHEAVECAYDQGKFFEMVDIIFKYQEDIRVSNLKKFAEFLELDTIAFNTCLDSGVKSQIVNQDISEGRSLGVQGTPTIFINSEIVENWQYGAFSSQIENALEELDSEKNN